MQGLVAEATLERKLRLVQDVCSNGFKVVAGRKNIGHIGHGQRDRFLDTEALAEEKKRGADTEGWSISWGIGQIFFRANACRRSEVDSSHTAMSVQVARPCVIHSEVHPPATKSVIVAVHEFFFAAIGRLRQMVASGKGAQQEGGEEHHGRWRGTIYFDCWGLGIPKFTTWEEYSSSIYAMVVYLPRLYHLKVLLLLFFKCAPWFSYPFLFKNLSNFLLFSFLVLSIFTFCKFIQLSKDCSLVVANICLPFPISDLGGYHPLPEVS